MLSRIRVGRDIGSAAIVADGYKARTDGLTSLAVVAGALGVAAGYPLAAPIVGLIITAVILVVLKQGTSQMLGRLMDAVEPELVDQVERTAAEVPGVQEDGPVRLRWRVDAHIHHSDSQGKQHHGRIMWGRGPVRSSEHWG